MSEAVKPAAGTVVWTDLSTDNAVAARDFYQRVLGWEAQPYPMDGYDDFTMHPAGGGEPVAGICHAKGTSAALPAQWIIYIQVADMAASLARCREEGGKVLADRSQQAAADTAP